MTTEILEHARTLAILPCSWFLENECTEFTSTLAGCIDVWHSELDDVRDDARFGRHLIGAHVSDHHGTVRSDTQLSAVRVADPHPLLEPERRLQPRHGRAYVGINQNRSDGDRWRRTIHQHD